METKTTTQIETESEPEVGSERDSIEKKSDSKENEKIEGQINNINNGHTFGSAKLSGEVLYNENLENRVNSSGTILMGVGQGVGDDAGDVTYSTKPDNNFNATSTLYSKKTTEFNGNLMETDARMNINSTEQNNNFELNNNGSIPLTMTQYVETARESIEIDNNSIDRSSAIGNVGLLGVNSNATYSTKFDNNVNLGNQNITQFATTTTSTFGEDINNLNMYNRTTVLQDQVQHIVHREIQPIVKTVFKPIIQKEIQPIIKREIQPIIQTELHPVVEKEIQPIIQREIQPIVKREIQPIVQREVQPIIKKEIQPILMKEEKHLTQKEIVPRKELSVQNISKTKIVPYIQKEEQHQTQRQVF